MGAALTSAALIALSLLLWPLGCALWLARMAVDVAARLWGAARCAVRRARGGAALAPPLHDVLAAASGGGGGGGAGGAPPITVVNIAGVCTELQVWEGAPAPGAAAAPAPAFILFPGNPGHVGFYTAYCAALHAASGGRLHVVTVGHASHSAATAAAASPRGAVYNLAEQVAHKAAVVTALRAALPPGTAFILAGHSVGAYMALEVARAALPPPALARAILLFPTLAHIGATVNGRKLMPLFRFGRGVAWVAAALAAALPARAQRALAAAHLGGRGADASSVAAVTSLLHPDVAANALWMALHEMREITALDEAHARALADRLVLYFGREDGWVDPGAPAACAAALPGARVIECDEGHKHAFVLAPASSARLAALTWGWVRDVVEGVEGARAAPRDAAAPAAAGGPARGGARRRAGSRTTAGSDDDARR
jgi:hypothetical protein